MACPICNNRAMRTDRRNLLMGNPQITLDESRDPATDVRRAEHRELARKNWEWLQDHWPDLLPQARGKFVAVAGQEAFVADTLDAALDWVRSTHPDDTGHLVEFVRPPTRPSLYSANPCSSPVPRSDCLHF